jgi:hypothetical protein
MEADISRVFARETQKSLDFLPESETEKHGLSARK